MSGNFFGCHSCGVMMILASSGYKPQILGNILQCPGKASTIIPHKSQVPRIGNPELESRLLLQYMALFIPQGEYWRWVLAIVKTLFF